MRGREECEADACAAHILMPEDELEKVAGYMSVWEIAEHFDVPEGLARLRITEFATQKEIARWEKALQDHIA